MTSEVQPIPRGALRSIHEHPDSENGRVRPRTASKTKRMGPVGLEPTPRFDPSADLKSSAIFRQKGRRRSHLRAGFGPGPPRGPGPLRTL